MYAPDDAKDSNLSSHCDSIQVLESRLRSNLGTARGAVDEEVVSLQASSFKFPPSMER